MVWAENLAYVEAHNGKESEFKARGRAEPRDEPRARH